MGMIQAEQTVRHARRRWQRLSGMARRGVRKMQRMIVLGHRVVAQTKLRIFKGITKSAIKIVSVFEPDTKILRRGKMHKLTEYGQMVKVQRARAR
jgi:hypothetical protein